MIAGRGGVLLCLMTAAALCSCSMADLLGADSGAETSPPSVQQSVTSLDASDSMTENALSVRSGSDEDFVMPEVPARTFAAAYFLEGENDKIRQAYDDIYSGIFNHTEIINVKGSGLTSDDFGDMLSFVTASGICSDTIDNDYRMYVDDSCSVTKVELSYFLGKRTAAEHYDMLMQRAGEIVAEAELMDSEYEKLKYFHDTLVTGCVYSSLTDNSHSAYGALCEGSAVCEGYAKAFALLCELSDISCLPVIGTAADNDGLVQTHMWNKVQCGGVWYNVDCTWDDPTGSDDPDNLRYDYFLVSDDQIAVSHSPEENCFMTLPEAWDSEGGYFDREGLTLGYYDDYYQAFYREAERCLADGGEGGTMRFRCINREVYDQVMAEMLDERTDGSEKGIESILHSLMQPGEKLSYIISDNKRTNVISLKIVR